MSVTLESEEAEPTPGLLPDGRPDPAYAAELGLIPAPFGRRSVGFIIDATLLFVLAIPVLIAVPQLLASIGSANAGNLLGPLILFGIGEFLVNAAVIVQLVLHGRKGFTLGKALVRVRSVNVARFDRPGFWRIVLRGLVLQCSAIVIPVVGGVVMLVSPLWDARRRGRGWLDYIGQNWHVDIANGLNPYDAKALRHARRRAAKPERVQDAGLPSLATGAAAGAPSQPASLFAPGARSRSAIVGAMPASESNDVGIASLPVVSPPQTAMPQPSSPQALDPAPPQPAMPQPMRRAVLTFDSGRRFTVGGTGLIGRNPEPRPGESVQHLLAIDDDTRSISKTHAVFGFDDAGMWIKDRESSNGTAIRSSEGGTTPVDSVSRAHVRLGDTVLIGKRSFVVELT